jgi:hypothetical protein
MKIVLKQKSQQHDNQPLIVMYEEEVNGKPSKKVISLPVGGELDLPDQTAYEVMAKYKGLFVQAEAVQASAPAAESQKSLKGYQNKSAVL